MESLGKTILDLPNELLLMVVKPLNATDFLSFSSSCKKNFIACQMMRYDVIQCYTFLIYIYCANNYDLIYSHLNFENSHSNGLSAGNSATIPLLHQFFTNHRNPNLLRSCDFTGCYWLNQGILGPFLMQCSKLEKLFVAETSFTIDQIVANIFPHCTKITSISFTMRKNDWTCDDPELLQSLEKLLSVEVVMENGSIFSELLDFLQ